MADRYWVGGTGNWSDDDNHWATSSGGAGGDGNLPTADDNVYFDANSFDGASQTVTVDKTSYCKDMDWTGATNNPTLTMTYPLTISGNAIFIADMVTTPASSIRLYFIGNLTTNGLAINISMSFGTAGGDCNTTLLDGLNNGTRSIYLTRGVLNTNGMTVSCGTFIANGAYTRTLTLGNSIINCSSLDYSVGTSTLTANTSTINCSGNFSGGGIDYNGATLNLTGATSTVTGSNTFAELNLDDTKTQTITLTAGTTQTCTTANLSGDATHQHTIVSGTAGTLAQIWATTLNDDYVTYTDILRNENGVIVSNCSGTGGGTFAGADGTYSSLLVEGEGAYPLTITGDNTFTTIEIDATEADKEIKFTDATTQEVTYLIATGANTIEFNKTSTGDDPAVTVSYYTGTITITDVTVTVSGIIEVAGGTANTKPTITLTCDDTLTSTTVEVANATTGETLEWTGNLVPDDVLVIDSSTFYVTLNGSASMANVSGQFPTLQTGTNYIGVSGFTGTMNITYRDRYF